MATKKTDYNELKDTLKTLQERGYTDEQIKNMMDTVIEQNPKEEKLIPESKIVKCIDECLGEVVDKLFESKIDAEGGMLISMLLTVEFAKLQDMILSDEDE